jgi:UDP-glucose 4-epimerase
MRCLVTGASGLIGSHLTRLLVEHGHTVAAMVRPSSDLWRITDILDRIELLPAELGDIDSAADRIANAAPEFLFHLAWAGITTDTRNLAANVETSLRGSVRLFEIAARAGCRAWVGLGSQAEFGPTREIMNEDLATFPNTPYGIAKLRLSETLRTLARDAGIRFVWLRLLATYGPMDDPRHLIPTLIAKLLAGERPGMTSGHQQWDYLYIDDAVECIYLAGVRENVEGRFVLASGQSHSIKCIAERIRDMIDPSLPLGFGELPQGTDTPMSLRADVTALRRATGWQPRTDLGTGLERTLNWHRTR